jgi:pyruvate dehydrogenase E2 component (dihydrolipoamide acetyltransferase)
MTNVLMPRLSDSMEEGTILTWLAADGDDIVEGQELVEVETDKATMTQLSEGSGVLSIVVAEGTTIPVGEVIARLEPAGARADAATPGRAAATAEPVAGNSAAAEPVAAAGAATEPVAAPRAAVEPVAAEPVASGGATGPLAAAGTNGVAANGNGAADAVPATPMARRIAAVHGVDLASLAGSGPRGRVVRADVMAAAGLVPEPAAPESALTDPAPAGAAATGSRGGTERVAPSRLQQLVARRMAEAKATIPEFQVQTEVEMSAAVEFRAQLKALAAAQGVPAPSLNDLIVKACAACLRQYPRANGSYVDGAFELHERVNVGVAVAADDALVVPVIHDADVSTLGQIATLSRRLAESVRAGTITPPELSGATFTVSNLGMYGMTAITPVINPPQAAILGVGAIRDVLARGADGELVDRQLLTLTLSCDHRILYGADAAKFLAAIKQLLESPAALAL